MLDQVLFTNENKFDFNEENNLMDVITKNCVVLCQDTGVRYFLAKEIADICEGKHEDADGHQYCTASGEMPRLTRRIEYLPTSIFEIDGEQQIVVSVEVPFVLSVKNVNDLWFAVRTRENKVALYPFTGFKNYKEVWAAGMSRLYCDVAGGRYYAPAPFGQTINNTEIGKE